MFFTKKKEEEYLKEIEAYVGLYEAEKKFLHQVHALNDRLTVIINTGDISKLKSVSTYDFKEKYKSYDVLIAIGYEYEDSVNCVLINFWNWEGEKSIRYYFIEDGEEIEKINVPVNSVNLINSAKLVESLFYYRIENAAKD